MLLIYSPQSSPRLEYVLQLFFAELIQTEYRITNDAKEFQSYEGVKLNYGKKKIGGEIFLYADDLLLEKGIREQKITAGEWKNIKALFVHHEASDLPFDPFAAAFYLVSRYEEYLLFIPDAHRRFPDKTSINFREGFHEIPVVNHYAIFLKEILLQRFPQLTFKNSSFSFSLTYDIDFAFAYRNKGLTRNAAGYWRSLRGFDWKEIIYHTKILLGSEVDPFDTFDFQIALHKAFTLQPVYFFLLADYGPFDKNISWMKKPFRHLIKKITDQNEAGIHSSYASNIHPKKIGLEKERLEKISGRKIFRNRQHFLKLQFPSTYQNLLANGIYEDYTMGYAGLIGFRAGIASPFQWYDLTEEKVTSLKIFPFAVMDATLHYYLRLSAEEALQKSKQLIDEVKKVNGNFQFLAHNDLISDHGPWKGWRKKFEELISYAAGL
ncbi:MAG TPA: polysaccharide deacetylase family protein [Chitinophagales bacterium]|nr:polysaccharide deacetylase family protein [Chitinophagales bacterium]